MHKKSKSGPPDSHTFYTFSAATLKDANIVKSNRIVLLNGVWVCFLRILWFHLDRT